MTKRMLVVFGALVLAASLVLLAGCRSCRDGAQNKRTDLKIQLDWKAGSEHAFLYAGTAKGYFAQAGIELQIVPGTGSSDSVTMVDAKSVDFALASGETLLQARGAEPSREAIALAVFYPNTPAVIYSLKEKGITKPEDLYGKRLGIIKGSSAFRNYEAFAAKIGLDRSRITEVPSTGDIREILDKPAPFDAMVHFGFQHPLQLRLQGNEVNVIPFADYGIKIYGQSLITNSDMVKERPDVVRRVVRAVQLSYLNSLQDPDQALRVFLQEQPGQDEKYAAAKLRWVNDFVRSGLLEGRPIGFHDQSGWRATYEYLKEQGLLTRDIDLDSAWTTSFLDPTVTVPKN